MEGLIPVIYKAIKKKRTHREYECLSSGAAQPQSSYNVSDFYRLDPISTNTANGGAAAGPPRHPRHRSIASSSDIPIMMSAASPPHFRSHSTRMMAHDFHPPQTSKQLMRLRSHKLFSCVTGV